LIVSGDAPATNTSAPQLSHWCKVKKIIIWKQDWKSFFLIFSRRNSGIVHGM
jgi:hypothetical protein